MHYGVLNRSFLCSDGSVVFPIGQGGMGIGGGLDADYSSDAECIRAIDYGLDLGLNFIDTAEGYGNGHSEELIGRVVTSSRRNSVFIATKFSPENASRERVLASAESSLKRLQTDYIDLYQIHWPSPAVPIDETLDALVKLFESGKVRHIGVSNFSARQMMNSLKLLAPVPLSSNQCEYNLFDRFAEVDVFSACAKKSINFIAYSPLDKGRTVDGEPSQRLLGELSERYGKSPSQIVLNWMVKEKGVYAIPKSVNLEHIRLNSESLSFDLLKSDTTNINKFCSGKPVLITPSVIEVSLKGEGGRKVYRTLEEAIQNKLGFAPSPRELASDLLNGDPVKPVRVTRRLTSSADIQYDLIEGRVRYWAWVIAFGEEKPIPAYVRSTN